MAGELCMTNLLQWDHVIACSFSISFSILTRECSLRGRDMTSDALGHPLLGSLHPIAFLRSRPQSSRIPSKAAGFDTMSSFETGM